MTYNDKITSHYENAVVKNFVDDYHKMLCEFRNFLSFFASNNHKNKRIGKLS